MARDTSMSLHNDISARRERLSITREQIGDVLGSNALVEAFESGEDVPLSVAIKIAEAVGLSFDLVETTRRAGIVIADGADVEEIALLEIPDSLPEYIEIGR